MRADTGTPELGITGVDLASLVPAGNGAMRMQCESSGACGVPSEQKHPRCRNARYGTASGRNDSTNKNLHEKNSEMNSRQLGDNRLASLVVLGSRMLGERVNELYSEKAKIAGRFLAEHASGDGRSFVRHQARC